MMCLKLSRLFVTLLRVCGLICSGTREGHYKGKHTHTRTALYFTNQSII